MNQFTIERQEMQSNTAVLEKNPATVIEAYTFVSLDNNGLAVKATAVTTNLLACIAVLSDTKILVSKDNTAVFRVTADAPFAKTMRNTEIDMAIDGSGNQLADVGASATDVFKVLGTIDSGIVGQTSILVKINRPIAS